MTRDEMRRAAKEAIIEREEELKGDGLYGSSTSAPILGSALGEPVGTFILVFGGTAVAVGAILARPTAGAAHDSLAVALAFGLSLAAVVAAVGHVSGAHANPARAGPMLVAGDFGGLWLYILGPIIGAVLVLLAPFIGGARGAAKGAKTGQNRP